MENIVQFKMPPKRIANSLMNSLRGGVVPRDGAEYIAVGRHQELEAILNDISIIEDGGSTFRFIVGPFGAGKSFLFSIIRSHVTKKGFLVMDADFSPSRRLMGTKKEGLATYRELINNLSSSTKPSGGALSLVLDKWINQINFDAKTQNISEEDRIAWALKEIYQRCSNVRELTHGFEFAKLLEAYYLAYEYNDVEKKDNVLKWFRGEYQNKRDAKRDLKVNIIISDEDWYEYIKLFAIFSKQAGYNGLLVLCDEMINLSKISNKISRVNNYEKLLNMYNDTLGGKAKYLGIIMGATPNSLEDQRRGVFSYEALKSRLSKGSFYNENMKDLLSPIILIKKLTDSELFVLLERLTKLHSSLFNYNQTIKNEDIKIFLSCELNRIGAKDKITPREIIRDFIEVLNLLHQNPNETVSSILELNSFNFSEPLIEDGEEEIEDEFSTFTI
ncbi:MAG: ATP-binding protein [Sphaerochaetaceae bacterium]|nr:ATP-binding protein [Sphaerochaetaceae bacterium]